MASQGYKIPFLGMTSGKLSISGEGGQDLDFSLITSTLESFGEIYSLDTVDKEAAKVIVCEYYDRRCSVEAVESLNGREILVCYFNITLLMLGNSIDCLERLSGATYQERSPCPPNRNANRATFLPSVDLTLRTYRPLLDSNQPQPLERKAALSGSQVIPPRLGPLQFHRQTKSLQPPNTRIWSSVHSDDWDISPFNFKMVI